MSHQLGHFDNTQLSIPQYNTSQSGGLTMGGMGLGVQPNAASGATASSAASGGGMSAAGAGLIGTGAQMMGQGAGQIAAWTQRKKKYTEQRKANDEHVQMRQRYMSLDVGDPYRDMTNPFENMTVNQQQANFEAQQQQQGMANMMGALQGAAGGSGIASLAQMMANQQSRNLSRASASIGMQEQQIGMMAAQTEARRQEQGAMLARKDARDSASTLFGMAMERKGAADKAAEEARMGLGTGLFNTIQGAGLVAAGAMTGGG
tara:strand:+ start:2794 stop:3576 length:783 start_codon:yes stop_codon:yes gene_type:complete